MKGSMGALRNVVVAAASTMPENTEPEFVNV